MDALSAWSADFTWRDSDNDLKCRLVPDIERLRVRLREIIARPEIAQALFVASPSLLVGLPYWHENPDSKRGRQAERALVKYFQRMSFRPTPFGLFSGCSIGRVESNERT